MSVSLRWRQLSKQAECWWPGFSGDLPYIMHWQSANDLHKLFCNVRWQVAALNSRELSFWPPAISHQKPPSPPSSDAPATDVGCWCWCCLSPWAVSQTNQSCQKINGGIIVSPAQSSSSSSASASALAFPFPLLPFPFVFAWTSAFGLHFSGAPCSGLAASSFWHPVAIYQLPR